MICFKFASNVKLLVRRDELRASKIMQERALSNPKIDIMWNTVVDDLVGTDKLEAALVRNTVTGEQSRLNVTGLFVEGARTMQDPPRHSPGGPTRPERQASWTPRKISV